MHIIDVTKGLAAQIYKELLKIRRKNITAQKNMKRLWIGNSQTWKTELSYTCDKMVIVRFRYLFQGWGCKI